MDEIKMNVKMLAKLKNMTYRELAEACGMTFDHLKGIIYGTATMSATDLLELSRVTGVAPQNIQTK